MRNMRVVLGLFLALLVGLPLTSWMIWKFQSPQVLQVTILDKSVSDLARQEHRGLVWLLRHQRIVRPDGGQYDPSLDYYGFFPERPGEPGGYRIRGLETLGRSSLDSLVRKTDLIYYADAYGVYEADWNRTEGAVDYSRKMYGGMSWREMEVMDRLRREGKVVIGEFNVLASPTPAPVRREFEKRFDLEWSGWVLRYFKELDTTLEREIPRWAIRQQLQQHGKWDFHGSGLVFVHEDGRLFILETQRHLLQEVPQVVTAPRECRLFGLPDSVGYPFWIDIVRAGSSRQVVSWYRLRPNDSGLVWLRRYRVPQAFPAVLRSRPPERFWYFAGDFVDRSQGMASASFAGSAWLATRMAGNAPGNRSVFFWNFYRPLMENILGGVPSHPGHL